jgi:hypothetical protein
MFFMIGVNRARYILSELDVLPSGRSPLQDGFEPEANRASTAMPSLMISYSYLISGVTLPPNNMA